jgi:hypothetical protein
MSMFWKFQLKEGRNWSPPFGPPARADSSQREEFYRTRAGNINCFDGKGGLYV